MFTEIMGKKINYRIRGIGQPIIFVHGWGGGMDKLKGLNKLALRNGFQTVALDLPGFGKSELPDANWGAAEYAQIIIELLKFLKIEKINYFGHSFGGSLGIYLSANKPSLINRLILCNSSYKRAPKKSSWSIGLFFNNLPLPKKIKQIIKKIIYRIFFPNSDLPNFPELESNYKKIMTQDLTPILPEVKQPTLILWGELDIQTPLSLARELSEKIKGSKLKIFQQAGHSLPLKYPELVFKEVHKFLC